MSKLGDFEIYLFICLLVCSAIHFMWRILCLLSSTQNHWTSQIAIERFAIERYELHERFCRMRNCGFGEIWEIVHKREKGLVNGRPLDQMKPEIFCVRLQEPVLLVYNKKKFTGVDIRVRVKRRRHRPIQSEKLCPKPCLIMKNMRRRPPQKHSITQLPH